VGRRPLRSHDEGRARHGHTSRALVLALGLVGVLSLAGCGQDAQFGYLPIKDKNTTNQTAMIVDIWNGSWIAALLVGVLVWGLMIWCVVVYRRRRGETGMPAQVRYNIPLEILYTVVPIMMVLVLFDYTATAEAKLVDNSAKPDVTINVVAKQWAWDFNYLDSNVYEVGVQGQLNGKPGVEQTLPTLYLPAGKRVQFLLTSRDVDHAFWIPAFLFKLDVLPGVVNKFQVVPQRIGTYQGKCSELCGEYHSEMLFNVAVVSPQDYDQHMAELRDQGKVGKLDANLGRSKTRDGGGAVPGNTVTTIATQGAGSNS